MNTVAILTAIFLFPLLASAQEFQYQFQDRPSKEANVIVISEEITGQGADSRLVGRVFNRGEEIARKVVVKYQVRHPHGTVMVTGKIPTVPEEMPGRTFADFNGRIVGVTNLRGLSVHTEADWSR